MKSSNNLGSDNMAKLVLRIAIPSMAAQFVSVLYSIVDRIFVGNIPVTGEMSLAGVGVCGPIVTMISAFASLVGIGGAPLMGIALGEGKEKKAKSILANCFVLLLGISAVVTALALVFREPMLRAFGASDTTYPFAESYFRVYVSGTVFALMSTGMYQFVVAQGYAKTGMLSVILGAVLNVILDPIFIYVFNLGVKGAAYATIISQAASAAFILIFLFTKSEIKITFGSYKIKIMFNVLKLGLTPFLIIGLDNVMLIAMNALLQKYGGNAGDELITVNTIAQSFMLVLTMPLGGISGGTQCILSYNFGAGNSKRVIKAQKYIVALCAGYTAVMFILARTAGNIFTSLFTDDATIGALALRAIKICTLMAVPLGVQYEIVDGFTGMSQVQIALPLSLWRKAVYFTALFIIPHFFDADMLFYAQPISDIVAVSVSIPVYFLTIKKVLGKREKSLI